MNPENNTTTIGSRIRKLREQKRKSLQSVAFDVHSNISTLSRIEKDKVIPDLPLIQELAKLFNVSPQYIAFGPAEDGVDTIDVSGLSPYQISTLTNVRDCLRSS